MEGTLPLSPQCRQMPRDEVRLDVHPRTFRESAEVRMKERMRDEGDRERIARPRSKREARALYCDRAFRRDVAHERTRNLDRKLLRSAPFLHRCHDTDPVHMTLHDMPLDAIPHLERSFEVDDRSLREISRNRDAERLRHIRHAERLRPYRFDGRTDPVD